MSTAVKKKLCWNCEGNVSRLADNCPYCGVYLHRENDDDFDFEEEEEEEAEAISEPTPPYRPQPVVAQENDIPSPPYSAQQVAEKSEEPYIQQAAAPMLKLSGGWKTVVLPLTFLLTGSIVALFGLILFFFSHDGMLTLRWNSNYWFIYLLSAIPLLFLGWKALQNIED